MTNSSEPAVVRLTVPFYDCDPLGCVWHGRYFQYFEQARTALLKRNNLGESIFQSEGFHMYIVDARCRYLSPLEFGDEFEVTARFTAFHPLIRVGYTLTNLTKERKSARGYTLLALTDSDRNRLSEVPALIKRLQQLA